MTEIERFRDAVEKFIKEQGWSPTRFGKEFAGDPLFVFQLRAGREPRTDTRARILEAITNPPVEPDPVSSRRAGSRASLRVPAKAGTM